MSSLRKMTASFVALLSLAVLAYGVVTALAYVYAERIIFQPPPASYTRAQVDFERIAVDDDAGVAAQHLPNADARYTILFSHGNAEDLGHLQPLLRLMRDAGFGVLAYDYRGYGQSTGQPPSEKRSIEDAEASYRYAVESLGIEPKRLILHGRSLGAGPTLAVAERHPVAGVVLESTFTSTYRVMTRWPLLFFDRFLNLRRVRKLDVPVLVIHGDRDRVIPPAHGRALFAGARGPKRALWVEGAGHNDLAMVAGDRYVEALIEFAAVVEAALRGG